MNWNSSHTKWKEQAITDTVRHNCTDDDIRADNRIVFVSARAGAGDC